MAAGRQSAASWSTSAEPRPVGMQLGVPIGQGPQFIEHGCDVARHADLIGRPWPYHRRHGSHPSRRHSASRLVPTS